MTFLHPLYLLLLALPLALLLWHVFLGRRREPVLVVGATDGFMPRVKTWRTRLADLPVYLVVLSAALLVVCLARPQTSRIFTSRTVQGIDIMLVLDVSTSMMADDIAPSRIEAARLVASDFVNARPDDNIGLTLFAGEAFTQCPLTTDHTALLSLLQYNANCNLAMTGVIADGTAIGMGLAAAVARLDESRAPSKVVILLTDGVNNTGQISPLQAAAMAKELGIRVYTIAAGGGANVRIPVAMLPNGEVYSTDFQEPEDPETLTKMAEETGGKYFKADDHRQLRQIYRDIDKMEKRRLEVSGNTQRYDAWQPFGLLALLSLLLAALLRFTVLRRLP
ncbi:MAG: VWA domain-containing protein [Alloprevotella sp.]|nr:VWA domain-containing protein [Alloprevotella sp.]